MVLTKDLDKDQQNRTEGPNINPYVYGQLALFFFFFLKSAKSINWREKNSFFFFQQMDK